MPALFAAALAIKAVLSPPTVIAGNCDPARVHFTGRITADAAGPVRYSWVRSDQPSKSTFTLEFDKPGTFPVTYDWLLKGPADGWVVLHVVSPVQAHSEKVRFEVSCRK